MRIRTVVNGVKPTVQGNFRMAKTNFKVSKDGVVVGPYWVDRNLKLHKRLIESVKSRVYNFFTK